MSCTQDKKILVLNPLRTPAKFKKTNKVVVLKDSHKNTNWQIYIINKYHAWPNDVGLLGDVSHTPTVDEDDRPRLKPARFMYLNVLRSYLALTEEEGVFSPGSLLRWQPLQAEGTWVCFILDYYLNPVKTIINMNIFHKQFTSNGQI